MQFGNGVANGGGGGFKRNRRSHCSVTATIAGILWACYWIAMIVLSMSTVIGPLLVAGLACLKAIFHHLGSAQGAQAVLLAGLEGQHLVIRWFAVTAMVL